MITDAGDFAQFPHFVVTTMNQFLADMIAVDEESQPIVPEGEGMTFDLQARRRRTASSSTTMPFPTLKRAAGNGAMRTADHLRPRVNDIMVHGNPSNYQNDMRTLTKDITRQVNIRASRLPILLLLLADLLPQPLQEGELDVFYDVLSLIDSPDLTNFEGTTSFMNFEWAQSQVGPLVALSLDVMSFMENVPYASDLDDSSERDDGPTAGTQSNDSKPLHETGPRSLSVPEKGADIQVAGEANVGTL